MCTESRLLLLDFVIMGDGEYPNGTYPHGGYEHDYHDTICSVLRVTSFVLLVYASLYFVAVTYTCVTKYADYRAARVKYDATVSLSHRRAGKRGQRRHRNVGIALRDGNLQAAQAPLLSGNKGVTFLRVTGEATKKIRSPIPFNQSSTAHILHHAR